MRKGLWSLAAALLLLVGIWGTASAAEAPDLTGECTFRLCSTKWRESLMTDRKYTSYWESSQMRQPWIALLRKAHLRAVSVLPSDAGIL